MWMNVCVFALICRLTYWNHKSKVPMDSSQYGNNLKFANFPKNASLKSYAKNVLFKSYWSDLLSADFSTK